MKRWRRWFIALLLVVLFIGYPCKPRLNGWNDWMLYTNGGILRVLVWSDDWNYGAMLYRETDTGWQPGIGEGVQVRTFDVTWQLRFEWKKRR